MRFSGNLFSATSVRELSRTAILASGSCSALLVAVSCLMFSAVDGVHAQSYPSRPVKIVVPWTPGGGNDVLGRVIAQKLSESWGQPVVVENKPGAGGNIGADAVAKSPPDGYTLLVAANNILSINPTMNDGTPFDPIKDFAPISLIGAIPVLPRYQSGRARSIGQGTHRARKK